MELFDYPSHGPTVSPDGRAFAHIVEIDGYPRAVQRYLTGSSIGASRFVTLAVPGPVSKLIYSPSGRWLACQVEPEGSNLSQVWVVTNDPTDPRAWRIDEADDTNAELTGWDRERVAITVEYPDCIGESCLVDPATGEIEIVDRRRGGRFLDSWRGCQLIRQGPRCDRFLVLRPNGGDVLMLPADRGSTSDPGRILDDKRPLRLWYRAAYGGLHSATFSAPPPPYGRGAVRVLARSDHDAEYLRLVLMTVNRRGGVGTQVLAERADAELDAFAVSDDGSTAALLWNVRGGYSELQTLSLSDGVLSDPIPLLGAVASQPSLSADGSLLAVTVEGPAMRPSVQLCNTRTRQWSEITSPAGVRPAGDPEFWTMPARDGLELNGWLYRAPGAEGPGPVAVWFHGGPEGQARPEYSYVFPTLLAAGITVFAPNVRGSSGFGRSYSHADDRERRWQGITDGVDIAAALISAGIADPRRLAATGRSYGGYLTNALVAFHPGTFTAAVAVCGMSDLHTFYQHTEPWIGAAAVSKYGDPVADAELLRELSPLHRVADITVPLRTIHGGNDTNVPVQESEQIVAALQALGRPADCVVIPGEGHEFTKPANRERLAELVRDWLLEAWMPLPIN